MTRFIIQDKPPTFPDAVGAVSSSVIALAVGTLQDGSPQIVGTGFAMGFSEYFATCYHVAKAHDELEALTAEELEVKGLKDAKFRIALPAGGKYVWKELEMYTWLRVMSEELDICIWRLVGIAIPPLLLNTEPVVHGEDLGVIGFPLGNALQGKELRPIVIRTTLSGGVDPTPANRLSAARVVLGTSVAGGFSGSPVFSASDASVVGMVASTMLEPGDVGRWPAGLSLAVGAADIETVLMDGVQTTTRSIKNALARHLAAKGNPAT